MIARAAFYEPQIPEEEIRCMTPFAKDIGMLNGPVPHDQVVATEFAHLCATRRRSTAPTCEIFGRQRPMTSSTALEQTIRDALKADEVPGAVVAVSHDGRMTTSLAIGVDGQGQLVAPDSLFPVTSLTKLAISLAILRLVDAGRLRLDELAAEYLPEADAAQPGVTIRHLLTHTSGLPIDLSATIAPWEPGLDWPALANACVQTPLAHPSCSRVQYSNVGYGVLGCIMERVTGQSIPDALRSQVLAPLGIEACLGVEPPRRAAVITDVRHPAAGTALEPFNSAFWRGLGMPWIGLLTTAGGALQLLGAFGGSPAGFLSPELLSEATRNQVGSLGGGFSGPLVWERCPWGLGPELHGTKSPHWAPPQASASSYGHLGASGSLVWFDPTAGTAWAVLGTRAFYSGWLLRAGAAIGAACLGD